MIVSLLGAILMLMRVGMSVVVIIVLHARHSVMIRSLVAVVSECRHR
jgi:hypothetical protein